MRMGSIIETDGLLKVELRHLIALAAVAEHASFTRAAAALGYTQSAVSQQITSLERVLGESLVERPGGPRPVRLTEAGEVVARHAEAVTARLQALRVDLETFSSGAASRLRLGAYQSVGAHVLPPVLQSFLASWPAVQVELNESGDDDGLLDGLERGDLDLGFMMLPVNRAPLNEIPLLDDSYVFLAAKGSALGQVEGEIPLESLGELALIGHPLSVCQRRLEEALRAAGVEPRVVFRSNDNVTVQALVRAGIGYGVVPSLTIDEHDDGIVSRPLQPAIPPRRIGLVIHADRYESEALRAFIALAKEHCASLAASRGAHGRALPAAAGP